MLRCWHTFHLLKKTMSESAAVVNDNMQEAAQPMGPRGSVAMWLSALFFMLILLIAIGGFVRLSGSGLSIPEWPLMEYGGSKTVLPPLSDDNWTILRDKYEEDYERLLSKIDAGAVGVGRLVPPPHDLGTFKMMFLIEWSHRAVAAILGIIALACWWIGRRHSAVTERTGKKLGSIILLIVFQAVLGGILVKTGTATQWLFVHLAVATIILSIIVWCILSLVQDRFEAVAPEVKQQRKALKIAVHATTGLLLIQLILGALVAGSRHHGFISTWPGMYGQFIPNHMWVGEKGAFWNFIENAVLHQWVHRWFAWVVVAALVTVFVIARKTLVPPRLTLALKVAATFLVLQVILGISNIFYKADSILIALTHLLMAMFIIVSMVLAMFDLKYEAMPKEEAPAA